MSLTGLIKTGPAQVVLRLITILAMMASALLVRYRRCSFEDRGTFTPRHPLDALQESG
jgi:hypothetical protein